MRPDGADIQTVVVGSAVAIALGVIVDPVVDELVLATGGCESLSTIKDPGSVEGPAVVQAVHAHDIDVVSPVVAGIIPLASIDAVDARLRPGEGISQPSRQSARILPGAEFYAVALAFARQYEALYLDLTSERLSVAVVDHVACLPVVSLQ